MNPKLGKAVELPQPGQVAGILSHQPTPSVDISGTPIKHSEPDTDNDIIGIDKSRGKIQPGGLGDARDGQAGTNRPQVVDPRQVSDPAASESDDREHAPSEMGVKVDASTDGRGRRVGDVEPALTMGGKSIMTSELGSGGDITSAGEVRWDRQPKTELYLPVRAKAGTMIPPEVKATDGGHLYDRGDLGQPDGLEPGAAKRPMPPRGNPPLTRPLPDRDHARHRPNAPEFVRVQSRVQRRSIELSPPSTTRSEIPDVTAPNLEGDDSSEMGVVRGILAELAASEAQEQRTVSELDDENDLANVDQVEHPEPLPAGDAELASEDSPQPEADGLEQETAEEVQPADNEVARTGDEDTGGLEAGDAERIWTQLGEKLGIRPEPAGEWQHGSITREYAEVTLDRIRRRLEEAEARIEAQSYSDSQLFVVILTKRAEEPEPDDLLEKVVEVAATELFKSSLDALSGVPLSLVFLPRNALDGALYIIGVYAPVGGDGQG